MHSPVDEKRFDDARSVCIGCGYQLIGLSLGAECPECGLSVARSILRDNAWTNIRWLREFSFGAVGLIATLVLLMVSILLGTSSHEILTRAGNACRPIALAAASGFGITLAWRYPWDVDAHRWRIFRRCLFVSVCVVPATIIDSLTVHSLRICSDIIVLHLVVEFSLVFLYLQFVATRLYEYPLMVACRVWIIAIILLVGLPVVVAGTSTGAAWHDQDGIYRFLMVIPCVAFGIAILAQQVIAAREAMELASR